MVEKQHKIRWLIGWPLSGYLYSVFNISTLPKYSKYLISRTYHQTCSKYKQTSSANQATFRSHDTGSSRYHVASDKLLPINEAKMEKKVNFSAITNQRIAIKWETPSFTNKSKIKPKRKVNIVIFGTIIMNRLTDHCLFLWGRIHEWSFCQQHYLKQKRNIF